MSSLVPKPQMQLVDPQAQMIVDVLQSIGLPHENIIASQEERAIIGKALPALIESLPQDAKKGARYLSKFVVGAGFGLFDYSLNAIWNEVVLDLHKKVIAYGLDIFYDAAIGGKNREFYQSEDDLRSVKDATLLDTCRKLELISETTSKKLKHMLDMRNDIGISHPTNYTINAYELLAWLTNCIRDVLNDRPTESALQVQAFIQNLRTYTQPLDVANLTGITSKINELASHHCGNILRTMFGIYVAADTDPQVRKNVSLLSISVWQASNDDVKYRLGLTLEGYNNNLHKDKYDLGVQFFQAVNGNAFRSDAERAIIVDGLIDSLLEKHNAWDNYHHEAPVADDIMSYIHNQQDILANFGPKLIKVFLMCRIGNGRAYCNGVSPRGAAYYDKLLGLLGDSWAPTALAALTSFEIQVQLSQELCRKQACQALEKLKAGVVNQRLLECIDFLLANLPGNGKAPLDSRFKQLSAEYLNWQ
ncbi:hypothetical protein OVT28_02305 [Pseudomonas aeruginosa]|uniref:hypothetical protein n=1 Tax=Pseudomonas aeruginosa TaxID=287 RepID=UPI00226F40BC|nr:hypothetical protein [Pseudomonas aeruginosa]MCY0285314.1 hypothetical protein [Pseudomonas aeruginosa]MCY0396495.1 hypothetical protein [Pseudomonas aeruginosa]HBO4424352.1 hypothetical protein [Pseudomonas aeruginosa]